MIIRPQTPHPGGSRCECFCHRRCCRLDWILSVRDAAVPSRIIYTENPGYTLNFWIPTSQWIHAPGICITGIHTRYSDTGYPHQIFGYRMLALGDHIRCLDCRMCERCGAVQTNVDWQGRGRRSADSAAPLRRHRPRHLQPGRAQHRPSRPLGRPRRSVVRRRHRPPQGARAGAGRGVPGRGGRWPGRAGTGSRHPANAHLWE